MTSHTKYTEEHKCSDTFPNVFYAAFWSLQYDLRFYFFYLNQLWFICMVLSVNSCFLVQVRVSKFQELRYNVALLLKEMNDLEKKSILQIQT